MKSISLILLFVNLAAANNISYNGLEEEDQLVTAQYTKYSWGLDRLNQRKLPLDNVYRRNRFTGKGIDVYVIDTGINDNIFFNYTCRSFIGNPRDCSTTAIHGTHVGSLIGSKLFGAAPGVNIINLKVLGDDGSGYISTVIKALDYLLDNKVKCAIVNMSLGGGFSEIFNMKVNEVVKAGNRVVVAAGNSNRDACDYSPASAKRAITVGATKITDDFAPFTNRGSCVDVYAPGVDIRGANGGVRYGVMSGTSMSSPFMAGAVAIQMERKGRCNVRYRRTRLRRGKKIGYVGK